MTKSEHLNFGLSFSNMGSRCRNVGDFIPHNKYSTFRSPESLIIGCKTNGLVVISNLCCLADNCVDLFSTQLCGPVLKYKCGSNFGCKCSLEWMSFRDILAFYLSQEFWLLSDFSLLFSGSFILILTVSNFAFHASSNPYDNNPPAGLPKLITLASICKISALHHSTKHVGSKHWELTASAWLPFTELKKLRTPQCWLKAHIWSFRFFPRTAAGGHWLSWLRLSPVLLVLPFWFYFAF